MYCKNYSWFFGLFLVFLFLVIGGGCSAISRCEPCLPVESGSAWKMTRTKSKQSAEFDNNEQKNLASNPDNQDKNQDKKQNSKTQKKSKKNAMSYLNIPPPPDSPE